MNESELNESWKWEGSSRRRGPRVGRWGLLLAVLASMAVQVYGPTLVPLLRFLELPLLVTVYVGMSSRTPAAGVLTGAVVGILQDALSRYPLGLTGMVKTLAGYAAFLLGLRFEVRHPVVRMVGGALFFLGHQALLWWFRKLLLGQEAALNPGTLLAAAMVNGILAVGVYALLDRVGES